MVIVVRPSPKLMVLVGAAALAAGSLAAAATLWSGTGAHAANGQTTQAARFPVPPKGGVLYARQMGGEALALGVVPGRGRVLAQASVLSGQGEGVSHLQVTLNGRRAVACGSGCYRVTLAGRPKSVTVRVRTTSWRVVLPAAWPPRDATAIAYEATAAWRALDSLSFQEHLASDAVHSTTSAWRVQSPDRVAYRIAGNGPEGIVVGDKRWDRTTPKGKWVESPQFRLTQPLPPWTAVRDAHLLGSGTLRGRRVWRISFFDPGTPGWFTLVIDQKTYHTLESEMITTAHFMHDVYGAFNSTTPIRPPVAGR